MSTINNTEKSDDTEAPKPRFGMGKTANTVGLFWMFLIAIFSLLAAVVCLIKGNFVPSACALGVSACAVHIIFRLGVYADAQGWHKAEKEEEGMSEQDQEQRRQAVLEADEPFGKGPLATLIAYLFFLVGSFGWMVAAVLVNDFTASMCATALIAVFWLTSRKVNDYGKSKNWF